VFLASACDDDEEEDDDDDASSRTLAAGLDFPDGRHARGEMGAAHDDHDGVGDVGAGRALFANGTKTSFRLHPTLTQK